MTRLAAALLAAVLLAVVLVWALQRHLVYFPSTGDVPAASAAHPGAVDVVLETEDGLTLGAWFVPGRAPARPVAVLVANGNGGDRTARLPLARALAAEGLSVLLFDYRGYGGNPGSPSEEGLARDVRAARGYLVGEAGFLPSQVLYYGESLGAAVVTELATEHPPAGLLLRSPFVDLPSVGREHYPWLPVRALLRDRFALVEHLGRTDVPVTVVLGTADSVVPAEQSRAVARAAPDLVRLVEIPGADHNDRVLLDGPEVVQSVLDLAARATRSA